MGKGESMTTKDITSLARKAGFDIGGGTAQGRIYNPHSIDEACISQEIARLVELARADEREACKQALLEIADQNVGHDDQFAKNIYFCVSVISDRGKA
jgi:hypothetical protein